MMRYLLVILLGLLATVPAAASAITVPEGASAKGGNDRGEFRAETKLVFDHESVAPGEEFRVGVLFELDPDWHVYGKDPGDSGLPTEIQYSADGVTFGELVYPPTQTFVDPSGIITTYGYETWVVFPATATVPPDASGELLVTAEVNYLACKIKCVPGNATLERKLPIGDSVKVDGELAARFEALVPPEPTHDDTKPATPEQPSLSSADETPVPTREPLALWKVLGLAFLGGVLLNLMPCVFPVLALKVFGFVSTGQAGRAEAMRHAGAYAGGTVASMALLAGAVLALRATGEAVGWGFQFQEPGYVAGLALVVTVFALNLFGMFEVPMMPVPSAHSGKVGEEPPVWRSFVDGIFAVVLATPCSAPFLGTAIGFALASSSTTIVLAFLMVGAGLAAPYVLASSIPALAERLPRPGPWMETFERLLGFVLMGTAVWLTWVYGRIGGADAMAGLLAVILASALGAWVFGKFQYGSTGKKWGAAAFALLLAGATWAFFAPHAVEPATAAVSSDRGDWVAFDEDEIARLQADGNVVFVDFTADWCITCKVNKRTVLASDSVRATFGDDKVVTMIADWTRRDERIRSVLARHGRAGVPMYLVYPAGGGDAEVLPEVLTPDLVTSAIDRAR